MVQGPNEIDGWQGNLRRDDVGLDWSPRANEPPSDVIRQNIQRTRARLDRTVKELHQRLDPQLIVHKLFEAVRENGRSPVRQVIGALRDNPLAISLIGIGLIWMLASQARRRNSRCRSSHQVVVYDEFEEYSGRALRPKSFVKK